ncbi:hypothetical protein D3C71_1773430 [compost metagenome]
MLRGGIALVVQPITLQGTHDVCHIGAGCGDPRFIGGTDHIGHDQCGQHSDDDQHHHQLDQGKATLNVG